MRKTKIVCTIGPASADKETLKQLISAGMNVARFNLSHGTHESHHAMIENLKQARQEMHTPVSIMIDTKGPEIRVGVFENGYVDLKKGQLYTLTSSYCVGNEKRVSVTLPTFYKIVEKGDKILLNDGLIKLKVEKVDGKDVICLVEVGGRLSNNKSINVPGVDLDVPYLSEVDKKDLLFGIKEGADVFAISFVGDKNDVLDVRKFLNSHHYERALICSKIESKKGVKNMDEIIAVSDSIMVARGDLGVEVDFEKIPEIQKELISKSVEAGKNVITATEMLESMIENIRPTRAEISDVANAVLDGSSCIMLSGETSAGKYPVLACETMSKIAKEREENIEYNRPLDYKHSHEVAASIGYAACELAHSLDVDAILVSTKSGHAAKCVARFRPACPIVACTTDDGLLNQMAMFWGVVPVRFDGGDNIDKRLKNAKTAAAERRLVKKGDLIVLTTDNLLMVDKV